jgi:predicted metal-binding membrane protein
VRMSQHGPGAGGAFTTGLRHGAMCVGCCWALMTIMFAVGVMNIPAMIGLAAVIFLEKVWRHGVLLSQVGGIAFLVLAVVAAVHPSILGGLYATGLDMTGAGGQMGGM